MEVKGPTWKPCGLQQELPRTSWSPNKPIWPQDGPTKLAGRGGGCLYPVSVPLGAVLKSPRLVFEGFAEDLEADSRLGREFLGVQADILL